MDFEDAKENIQPLAAGRNASILHASLRVESPQELLAQRRELEQAIHGYNGDDPLEPWYSYISWIEQSFPSGGKESGLEEVLTKCLSRFENEEKYFQDRRMIKLYMKFIDSHQHPMECYQQLFNAGIGTMVADFYICWAYHYDSCGNTRKADEIFRRGIACRAQPLDELQEAHQHFGFSVAQRLMYQDDEDVKESTKRQFEERRLALTSLRGHRRKAIVGSIRTGSAVKSLAPGTVQSGASSSKQSNTRVQIFQDENACPNSLAIAAEPESSQPEEVKSVVRSIIDAARNQENLKEPGPWNKAHDKKKSGKLFGRNARNIDLGFSIHEDVEMEDEENDNFKKPLQPPITDGEKNYNKPFMYPTNFRSKNMPQSVWVTPVTIENESDPRTVPQYNKCFMYPRPNVEFQPEEYRAFCWFKRRGISNEFTAKRNTYWCCNDVNANVRQYPNFAKQSKPQKLGEIDTYYEPEKKKELVICFTELYDSAEKVEYQWEEVMAKRLRRNNTILMAADMDETHCGVNERAQRRKSFFPSRKSIAPRPSIMPVEAKNDLVQNEINKPPTQATNSIETTTKLVCASAPTMKSSLPFEIFEDTSPSITHPLAKSDVCDVLVGQQNEITATVANSDFQFKTPALPSTTSSTTGLSKAAITNKLGFEIYTEPSIRESVPSPLTTDGAVGGVLFDPEETCSTQTFNIFIKSQSVSTPKMIQKVAPRQFGPILKVVPNPPEISTSPISTPTVENNVRDEQENILKPAIEYSPLTIKQLSTILETSEHGTTQGTCTTGGTTTKSSSSTSDGEGEREIATRILMPHTDLEPLEEQSRESSTIPNEENSNIRSNTTTQNKSTHIEAPLDLPTNTPQIESAPPAQMRLKLGSDEQVLPSMPTTGFNFSIFEDEQTEQLKNKHAGNFTRIDDREDTAAGYAMRSVRFQEDKTETIHKMLSIVKFQEDKTETITKLPLATAALPLCEAEQTGTIPKITLDPPALPAVKNVSSNLDDSFEFFGQTPPGKSILHPRYEVSAFKECMDARTPLMSAAKRECKMKTPDVMLLKAPRSIQKHLTTSTTKTHTATNTKGIAIFEDEVDELAAITTKPVRTISPKKPFSVQKVIGPTVPAMHKVIARESILPDFSFIEETQPKPSSTIVKTSALAKDDENWIDISTNSKPTNAVSKEINANSAAEQNAANDANEQQAKADLSDSYLKDFSEILDTQAVQTDNKWHRMTAISKPTEKLAHENINNSFLKDFSAVMESRSTENEKPWLQSRSTAETAALNIIQKPETSKLTAADLRNDEHKLKFDLGNSYLKDFSMIMDTQQLENQKEQHTTQPLANQLEIPETQPAEEVKDLQQNKMSPKTTNSTTKAQLHINESYLKEFSVALEENHALEKSPIKRTQEQFQKLTIESIPTTTTASTALPPTKPLMFLNSFMKDFSGFQGPLAEPLSTKKTTTRLTFLNESKKLNDSVHINPAASNIHITELKPTNAIQSSGKLHFLDSSRSSLAHPPLTNRFSSEKYFELNAETAMFSTNISMIKNSTLLQQVEPSAFQAPTPIKEKSLHIKVEPVDQDPCNSLDISKKQQQNVFKTPPPAINGLPPNASDVVLQPRMSVASTGAVPKPKSAIKTRESKIPQPLSHTKSHHTNTDIVHVVEDSVTGKPVTDDEDDAEMSIYFKQTPKTPKIQQHIWNESSPSPKTPSQNVYVHREVDLNVTNQIIDNVNVDPHVNPFNGYLQGAFLEQIDFSNYIAELPNCMMVGHVSRLNSNTKLKVNDMEFDVLKLVGEGAYGAVYCGTDKTGKKYALKQERPPNFWEYYICLEVHSRLNSDDMVSAFMSIDYALIGNNASILISRFSVHGSLITVCNKVKKHTLRNVDEYVVMLLTCQLLSIIDHLHAVNIIHADIKADNFILMEKLDYNSTQYAVQLIDFGVSIDMKLFKSGQKFNYVHNENAFKCVEMREGRPWTYQLDLYGLAGVIHVLLFGKFMDIEQRPSGIWMHKTHVPRYINRTLWDTIFQALLNVRDCETMPNLQNLRALIKEEIAEKEKFVIRKIAEFNSALSA
ncbi:uncharacterized protein LOC101463054 [Ceratitis capitata]|uniref:uncharacterized protein LOC101463054 n=1 Tax=Ceratitis capitata TaxID=7213 RepID=UPI000329E640|nr:uncharacterized protein LOC101463054 [Ceratitis capitata]